MLDSYVQSAHPALAVETVEEERFVARLLRELPDKSVLAICAGSGLKDLKSGLTLDAEANFYKAFLYAATHPNTVLAVFDWQHVARNALAYRGLKECFADLKANGSCIVFVAPTWKLPDELVHDLPVLPMPLPSREQLHSALSIVAESAEESVSPEQEAACLNAAAGLTLQEAENAFALALVECNALDARRVEQEKMRLVKNSGYLEVWPAVDPALVGGLDGLKEYFVEEVLPCRDDEDLRVRGVLLLGLPGTGKSLAAKAAGAMLGWPVLRMDIGALKGSLVGQSESNIRAALKLAEAVAPCVVWLDEIEKSIGGYQSSASTDSGVTLGMVGQLLTWMQEHRSPILTLATANDHHKLPPELTRAGRFDEKFFVDLPTLREREAIACIHLQRFGCDVCGEIGDFAGSVAAMTEGWTGAEIEQLVKSAARRSNRQPSSDVLAACVQDIKPLSVVRAEETEALRTWARSTLRLANAPEAAGAVPAPVATRRLHRGGDAIVGGISMN